MKNSIPKLLFVILLLVFAININVSEAQVYSKEKYPEFFLSPLVGVQFPVGNLNDVYSPSWNAGLDFAIRINRETAFYLKAGYIDMVVKSDAAGPRASFIEVTAGPRYIFSSDKLKAKFFLEAGGGLYVFHTREYTIGNVIIPSDNSANVGVNAGPGAMIPLSNTLSIEGKSKFHYIFNSGSSQSFITASVGLVIKL